VVYKSMIICPSHLARLGNAVKSSRRQLLQLAAALLRCPPYRALHGRWIIQRGP
jgi:hypothetical protein